jgi:hypothetical protein
MEFGFVIGFIDHLQIVTTSNFNIIANSHMQQFTTSHAKSSQSALSSPVIVWQQLPVVVFPLTLGSRTIPVPQLSASSSNKLQGLNRSSPLTNSPAHQPTRSTALTKFGWSSDIASDQTT